MRIALTHNLRLSDSEEEAEFDTEETVNALAAAMERLGHRVEKMEVSGPASRTVARLEAFSPDLIFNTAEGRRGRFREAFFPALFEELGFPYTGSDAAYCGDVRGGLFGPGVSRDIAMATSWSRRRNPSGGGGSYCAALPGAGASAFGGVALALGALVLVARRRVR